MRSSGSRDPPSALLPCGGGLEPSVGSLETLLQRELGVESEQLPRLVYVQVYVLNLASPDGKVLTLQVSAQNVLQSRNQLIDARHGPGADIVGAALNISVKSQHYGPAEILYEDKIPRLGAVAVDGNGATPQSPRQEACDYACLVGGMWSVDVGEPERDGIYPEASVVCGAVAFGCQLAGAIWGERTRRALFAYGRILLPHRSAGGGEDHALDSGPAGRFQNVEGAQHVHRVIMVGVFNGAYNAGLRGQMDNGLDSPHALLHERPVTHVALSEIQFRWAFKGVPLAL